MVHKFHRLIRYVLYVNDNLVLAKSEDIALILEKLNSFHPQINLKFEKFMGHNDVNFLDIKLDPQGTTIYLTSTHTGQYRHYSSFTPWSRKTAWIRALVQRATRICSTCTATPELRNPQHQTVRFLEWFPRWICDKLIGTYTCRIPKATHNENVTEPAIP